MLQPKREKIFNLRNFSQFGSLNVALQTGSLPLTSMRRVASRRTRQIEVATCCRLALLSGIIRKLKRDHSLLRLWAEINVFIDCFAPFCKLSHVNFSVCILFTAQSNLTV